MYTASRPLVDRYFAQALLTAANSTSISELAFEAGLAIAFFTKGYRLKGPTILFKTAGFCGFGMLSLLDPAEAITSCGPVIVVHENVLRK